MKLTPNLIVEDLEACLPFWVTRFGFQKTVEVPHGDKIGFVILVRDDLELMLQSNASLAEDLPAIASGPYRSVLYLRVSDLAPIRAALDGWPIIESRKTSYGADEIIVDDPAGNRVFFASR